MRNWKKFNEEELKVERNNEENYLYTLIKFEMALQNSLIKEKEG